MAKTVVALYDDISTAHMAHHDLDSAGFGKSDVSITALDANGRFRRLSGKAADRMARGAERDGISEGREIDAASVVDTLERDGLPSDDANAYAEGVRRGGCMLVVHTSDDRVDEVAAILERHNPLPIYEQRESWRAAGWTGFQPEAGAMAFPEGARETTERTARETRVPLAEEEVHVGKRSVSTGGVRVHTFVREVPVEENIRLREEHVDVERRTTDRPAGEDAFKERTIEMEERHEEPIISKEARVTEEVVMRKGVEEHEEKVRDTVRRTDIDVEGKPEQRPEHRP